jgi:hypothetical protein
MTEPKPCTRCNGSGTEPDPLNDAWTALQQAIDRVYDESQRRGVRGAAARHRELADARITILEAALRDMLGGFEPQLGMRGTHQILQVPNEDIDNWRKILEGES